MVNYSQLIGEALEMMYRPSVVDSPSGGASAKAPRWDLTEIEGYGGGIRFSWSLLMFSGYMGICSSLSMNNIESSGLFYV